MEKIENSFFANYNYVVALVQSTKNLFNKNMHMKIPLRLVKVAYTALRQLAEICFGSSFSYRHPLWLNKSIKYTKETSALAKKLALNGISDNIHLLDTDGNYLTYDLLMNKFGISKCQSINQFSGPAYPWGVAGAAAQVGASKHLDPLQQRIDALLGCQGETN